ncbi:MAG: PIN domain-containing protein [Candidatus Dormibacteraeota bacterium]|nr:PIN domain-containing protein [Candidatus Dormibacteraeota bacterium]
MALVCDTSGLLAYFDGSDAYCAAVSRVIEADSGPFIVSPYVVAELDYLLATRRGVQVELAALTELSGGAWELPTMEVADLREACTVIDRYRDQDIGVADASLVALAHRFRTDRLLTLDRRHFRVIRTTAGRPFTILPEAP